MKLTGGKLICPFFILLLLASGVFAQTPEVNVIFKINGEEIKVQDFKVSIFEKGSSIKIKDLETKDNTIIVPSEFSNCENFDVQVFFNKYKLTFPDFNKHHFNNEWVIDVTDPINQTVKSQNRGQKKKLIKQYSITFHPLNEEGAYQLIEIYEN